MAEGAGEMFPIVQRQPVQLAGDTDFQRGPFLHIAGVSIFLTVKQHHFREDLFWMANFRPRMVSRIVIPSAPFKFFGKFFTVQVQTTQRTAAPQLNDQSVEQSLAGKTGCAVV